MKLPSDEFESMSGTEEPTPLPDLPPVPPLPLDALPPVLQAYVEDVSHSMQCPPDYVAIPLLVAAGSVAGNRVGIAPKAHADWIEYPNLWGAVVGMPGTKKSPGISAGMRPLKELERQADEEGCIAEKEWKAKKVAADIEMKAARDKAKTVAADGGEIDIAALEDKAPPEPGRRRFVLHNATLEAIIDVLKNGNPTGTLLFQDELSGILAKLDKPDGGGELRSFLLTAWCGNSRYSLSRIVRGHHEVEKACISLLGGIQPAMLRPMVESVKGGGRQADGFLDRFSLLTYPDNVVYQVGRRASQRGRTSVKSSRLFEK